MPTGTNTVFFVAKSETSQGRKVTYTQMVASIRPTKAEVNRVGVTVGGDRLDFPGVTTTHCTSLTTTECLLNSTLSTPGARFITLVLSRPAHPNFHGLFLDPCRARYVST